MRGAAAAIAVLLACAHSPAATRPGANETGETATAPEEGAPPPRRAEVGLASFYGPGFQGRRTASGARFNMRRMTCAHRTHPFGAWLRVTDLETGRSVEVQVTDRGPFGRGRIVDLSLAAAEELGIVERGVARVRVERLR